ncbi:MAG: prolyl oligopeptidase family serine peptidase [Bacteroidota bacterium]
MKYVSLLSLIILFSFGGNNTLIAQNQKEALSLEDVRKWRTHSVSLSDDGNWYTKLYRLIDKPESLEDSTLEDSTDQEFAKYFQEDNQTDILYICSSSAGVTYTIPEGKSPRFSSGSDWIAYKVSPKSENKEDQGAIELKHLSSDFTKRYQSNASYRFLEDKNFFITTDENSLLIYDLDKRREHYIGNIGEFLINKNSANIIYTIVSEDKRGNGIYLYNPESRTTRALETANFNYSNLSWNNDQSELAAFKYTDTDGKIDYDQMSILVLSGVDSENSKSIEYPVNEIEGMPENMVPSASPERGSDGILWSNDENRFFIKIKVSGEEDKPQEEEDYRKENSTVQIWHGKDQKLLSERIMENENKEEEFFDAIFFRNTNTVVQLTSDEIQNLIYSNGADNWAIGTDNRAYISDWDISKNDLYRIDLKSGKKKLIEKAYRSRFSSGLALSPDAEKMILWDGKDYWVYDFNKDSKKNITEGLAVSFVDKDYDKYGFIPDYGFVGWVKDQNAVIVNHKMDMWLLPLDKNSKAKNLTASITSKNPVRFRFENTLFAFEDEIEKRYIDLSESNILYAFNTKTKEAGYYSLKGEKLRKLIYKAGSFSSSRWRNDFVKSKNSDAIIYKFGDYLNYPEAYLSTLDFSKSEKITNTNPQQAHYNWGKRILIDYTNEDGVPLQAVLSIPNTYQKGQKLPMIVYSYEKLSDNLYSYATPYLSGSSVPEMLYVSDGYLFLQPDIHFNVGTPHSDMHECIGAAIDKVIELGYVDEKRIGYEGFSFGGHCGMYISTQENKFAAIAAGAGVSNLVQGFNLDIVWDGSNEQDYYMTGQGRLGTDPTSNIEMFISESAVFNANTMNTPLLLFHGTADKVVQWEHSFGFYSILRYLKKPVVFLSYKGEGHGLRQEGNRLDIQLRLKEYFDHYLKDKEIQKWMIEDLPFPHNKEAESNEKGNRKLPKWK